MTTLRAPQDMHFSTGDGTVTLYFPASFGGELDASTGDGRIESDFPLQLAGRLDSHSVHATIGAGGPSHVTITTGDGDVRVRKQ